MSKKYYIIPIFVSHEGCPHNCVFCNQNNINGNKDLIDARYVYETINSYLSTINSKGSTIEVSFFGGTFTAINIERQRELLSVAKKFKDDGRINYIRLSTRPDYIDEFILNHLKEYSVDIIELGVQSMDSEVLIKSGRGHTKDQVVEASRLIKKFGFLLGHQMMLGLPGDTVEKDLKTLEELIDLKPDMFRVYPALVIKDTPMELMYKSGTYVPYTLNTAVNICKEIYCHLIYNNILILRMGLQPTENISEGKDIISGPFHPAFRELVEGSLMCDMILDYAKNIDSEIQLYVNDKDISKLYTNKKYFFIDIKKQLNTKVVNVNIDNSIERGNVVLKYNHFLVNLSINDYINKKVKEGKTNNS